MNTNQKLPEPVVSRKSEVSKIWFLPLLALIVGVSMLVAQWRNQGVNIEISFDTAAGLEVGKTKVKYRDVEIGEVTNIAFNSDLSNIVVSASINKPMRALLAQDTLFWVVRPRVGASGVTGFGTLVSGAYIEIAPGNQTTLSTSFEGLESPPLTSPTVAGLRLKLTSDGGKPLRIGHPVLYKGFKVGRVETFEFEVATASASYDIFIESPYDALVTTNTHFWNAGGAALQTSATGIKVDIGSLETLVTGGVEFGLPAGMPLGERAQANTRYQLFESKSEVDSGKKYRHVRYLAQAKGPIGGLAEGAPVEFRGIRIGTVESAEVDFNDLTQMHLDTEEGSIPIVLRLEPGRVSTGNSDSLENQTQLIDQWILAGLTATIEPANLLTGALKISLDVTGSPLSQLKEYNALTVIPWSPARFESYTERIDSILTTISELPINTTVEQLNTALASADETLLSLNKTLQEFEETAVSINENADVFQSIKSAVRTLEDTLELAQPLIQEIENNPSSLVFGKPKPADIELKARSNRTGKE